MLRDGKQPFCFFFFHPDYTVGFGITPKSTKKIRHFLARGLVGKSRITAGGEFHPAPKIAIYFFCLYCIACHEKCQLDFSLLTDIIYPAFSDP